jgi:hypothetical protein
MLVYGNKILNDQSWTLETFSYHACAFNALLRLTPGQEERMTLDRHLWTEDDEKNFQRLLQNVKNSVDGFDHPDYT